MTSHKGPLTIDEGAVNPTYLALLPPGAKEPQGKFIQKLKVDNFWWETPCDQQYYQEVKNVMHCEIINKIRWDLRSEW